MYDLDTNHVSELSFSTAAGLRLSARLDMTVDEIATTAVTVEESLRGWLAEIRRFGYPRDQVLAYQRLVRQVDILASWTVLPWDEDAVERFDQLSAFRRAVGTQDLKIACICLAHDATLLTRNVSDFVKVPNLRIQNWLE